MKFINLLKKELAELVNVQMLATLGIMLLIFMMMGNIMTTAINDVVEDASHPTVNISDRDNTELSKQLIEALKAQSKHEQNTMQNQPDLETFGVKTGETCADAISRQEAIDVMAELQGRASTKAELTGISKAWKRIKKLPPVTPKQEWIPYSPETKPAFGCYLVTCKNGGIYTGVFTEWGWDIDDVVAYNTMVLPKPYGE